MSKNIISKNKVNKVVTDMQKKIALAVLDEIEELINTGVFYNSVGMNPN